MLHVILLILKIIGIVILCILGLLISLILLVLFVPIRYKVYGEYHKKPQAEIGVFWLLHCISIRIQYKDSELDKSIKIFGIKLEKLKKLFKRNKKESYDEEFSEDDSYDEMDVPNIETIDKIDSTNTILSNDKTVSIDDNNSHIESDENLLSTVNNSDEENTNSEFEDKKSILKLIINKIKKIWNSICKFRFKLVSLYDKIKMLFHKLISFKEFIELDETKEAISFVKTQSLVLIKLIKPKKVKGYIEFGTGDPATTGKILGVIYMIQIYGNNKFTITPFFEEKKLDCEVSMSGKLTVFSLLVIALRVYRNKNLKETIGKGRNL